MTPVTTKTNLKRPSLGAALLVIMTLVSVSGCSSSPEVKKQAYATLSSERVFETEFKPLWKSVLETFRQYKIDKKDVNEGRDIQRGMLRTDWVLSESRDKYIEYKVNASPRKKYLQVRHRYEIKAQSTLGGVHVHVGLREEIERLDAQGRSKGWDKVDVVDSSRQAEILDRIQQNLLAAPNL